MYSKEKRSTVGGYDNEPISPKYQSRLNFFRKTLAKTPTKAESHFEERIASLICEEAHTYCKPQRIFYMTDQIAFITDFYFKNFKVVVEVDGPNHYKAKEKERDQWRDGLLLEHFNVRVIRFSNRAVLTRTNEVFNKVVRFLAEQEQATPSHLKYLKKVYSHLFY